MKNKTFTIHIEPVPGGGLRVTVAEIGADFTIQSSNRDDAIDAAHLAIEKWTLAQQPALQERAKAS